MSSKVPTTQYGGSQLEPAAALRRRARTTVAAITAAGVIAYERKRHLPRLIPIDPAQLADRSVEARRAIVARLARALRAERNRGRAGHWTYDLNRHIGLMQAYAAEREVLAALAGQAPRQNESAAESAADGTV